MGYLGTGVFSRDMSTRGGGVYGVLLMWCGLG